MSAKLSDVQFDSHYLHSVLRERVVEHVFVGEVLRHLWRRRVVDVEVLRSEFDAGGYDLVLSHGPTTRHIQFKTMRLGGKAASVKVSLKLAEKPSGCVIWIVVTDDLDFDHFRWFGDEPGKPLPAIDSLKAAKHTKANAQGVKAERPNQRVVPSARFVRVKTLEELLELMFGPELYN